MSRPRPVEYAGASAEVRAVFDDIKATRKVTEVNNFWKYLAADPALLKRTWETQKAVLAPGALDHLVKEMIYLAVSVTNSCSYGIACHTALARKAGMTDAQCLGNSWPLSAWRTRRIVSLMDFACRSMTPSTLSAYASSQRAGACET